MIKYIHSFLKTEHNKNERRVIMVENDVLQNLKEKIREEIETIEGYNSNSRYIRTTQNTYF